MLKRLFNKFRKSHRSSLFHDKRGQNMIEYMLLFAVVLGVIFTTLGDNGIVYRRVNEALDIAVTGIECMADSIPYGSVAIPGAAWSVGSWSACAVGCGQCTQFRSVTCPTGCCSGTKPAATQTTGVGAGACFCFSQPVTTDCGNVNLPSGTPSTLR